LRLRPLQMSKLVPSEVMSSGVFFGGLGSTQLRGLSFLRSKVLAPLGDRASPWSRSSAATMRVMPSSVHPLRCTGVAEQVRSMGSAGKSGKKMKSYSSYKKRFKLSASTGMYTRRRCGAAHLMTKKSKTQKRRLRLSTSTHSGYAKVMRRLGFKKTKFN